MTNGYLTLDGLLAVAHESMTGSPARAEDIPLANEGGVMKGSAAFFLQGTVSDKTMFGRLSHHELAEVPDMALPRRGGKLIVDQASGKFRAWMTKFLEVTTTRVFWFGVGDPDRVLDLLKAIPGVGRKATLGYGSIDHDAIVIDKKVPDCSFSFLGKPARPLPVSMWRGRPAQQAMASVAHPYWDSPMVRCVVPVTRFFTQEAFHRSAVTP
jgi:hypothetical protein